MPEIAASILYKLEFCNAHPGKFFNYLLGASALKLVKTHLILGISPALIQFFTLETVLFR